MKHLFITGALLLAWSAPARCEDSFEALNDEGIKALNTFADVLAKVKDKESGERAKPDLRRQAEKLSELKGRSEKLGMPKGARKEELEKKYKPKLEEAMKRVQTEMLRISTKIDGGQALIEDYIAVIQPEPKK